jgi:hypothetical protein
VGKLRFQLLLVAVAAAMAVAPGSAHAAGVAATCTPGPCGAWQSGDVTITWSWASPPANPGTPEGGDCGTLGPAGDPQTSTSVVSGEGDHAGITCRVDYADGATSPCAPGTTCTGEVDVKIDRSDPVLQGYAPPAPNGANGWFVTKPVLTFTWTDALSGPAGCPTSPLAYTGGDTKGASLAVPGCSDAVGHHSDGPPAFAFRYDGTPPAVSSAVASRPPDHGDWYNHSVSFTFVGSDVTSGIGGCTSATYAGPDDSTATLRGSCWDNAGNRTTRAISFKYDDHAPQKPKVFTVPANRSIDISWAPPGDADSFVLTRRPAVGSTPPRAVYRGSAKHFVDRGLRNGRKYDYLLTTYDAAGNSSTVGHSAVPDGSSLRPFIDGTVSSPPRLRWRRVRRAHYYNVQLFKGRKKVLSAWPKGPRLQLKSRWRYNRHSRRLASGLYRWYVWPGYGSTKRHRYGKLVGSSTFRFVR